MKQHFENIGKTAQVKIGGVPVKGTITNIRSAFGRIDYEVTLNGTTKWVDHTRLEVLS